MLENRIFSKSTRIIHYFCTNWKSKPSVRYLSTTRRFRQNRHDSQNLLIDLDSKSRPDTIGNCSPEDLFEFSSQILELETSTCEKEKLPTSSSNWKDRILACMTVHRNFINVNEETELLNEIEPYLNRLHYESSHWDDAIHEYRETERSSWKKKNQIIINRIRDIFPKDVPQLKLVHVLDLAAKGLIKPHIDAVRFCGNTIAGLSLLSDSVMRLRHDVHKDIFINVYLPRRSLYIMTDIIRYEFAHEILGNEESQFKGTPIVKHRRISIVCRNEPTNQQLPEFPIRTFKTPEEVPN